MFVENEPSEEFKYVVIAAKTMSEPLNYVRGKRKFFNTVAEAENYALTILQKANYPKPILAVAEVKILIQPKLDVEITSLPIKSISEKRQFSDLFTPRSAAVYDDEEYYNPEYKRR